MIAPPNADHERIRVLADRLDPFLTADEAPLGPDFARRRWELIRELATHFAYERAYVRAQAAACDARTAQRLDVDLEDVWRDHVARWTGARVQAHWRDYRVATRALLSRIRMRMTWEEGLETRDTEPGSGRATSERRSPNALPRSNGAMYRSDTSSPKPTR